MKLTTEQALEKLELVKSKILQNESLDGKSEVEMESVLADAGIMMSSDLELQKCSNRMFAALIVTSVIFVCLVGLMQSVIFQLESKCAKLVVDFKKPVGMDVLKKYNGRLCSGFAGDSDDVVRLLGQDEWDYVYLEKSLAEAMREMISEKELPGRFHFDDFCEKYEKRMQAK